MIQVNNLCKSYGGHVLFDSVNLSLNSGERLGLVGRNGHGKTTLLRMILGLERHDSGGILIPDGYKTGHLSQHIHFTEDTVIKEACLSLTPNEDHRDETYKAASILMGLGFSESDYILHPSDISGGFQVRLNLAKLLLSDPNLLLLDEPTNYLDILSLRWLARFLRGWKKELILITHDRGFMDSVTTHTAAIHRCKIRKVEGTTSKVYQQLMLEEEIYEKTRVNDEKKRKETEEFINRFRAKATKAKAVQSRIKSLEKRETLEKLSQKKNLAFSFNSSPFTGKELMAIKNLSFGFDDTAQPLINNLSFSVRHRDRIAIIGKNGKGKTTLLNLLAGEYSPTKGIIRRHQNTKLAYFGQTNIERLDPNKTVEEDIMDANAELSRGSARNICGVMMFSGENALKKIGVLSGGEKSRVLLGKLLVSPVNLLLLDEPSNHLDMESAESLLEAINDFDGAVIIVTHNEAMLMKLATRLIIFDGGEVCLFEGTYTDFLERVGWRDEIETIRAKASGSKQTEDKQQLKRTRAELINKRSRTLKALQDKINSLEKEIISLEERLARENKDILEASLAGDGEAIQRLSKSIHAAGLEIEKLFPELEIMHMELESKTKEFQERLDAVGV
jgi:ATP-binding cassette subfamily F protein 3